MTGLEIKLPENVKKIIDTIQKNGHEAYAVGGCIRDSVLGREPDDWDITTSARPEQVKELFKRTIDTGIKHGTVTVMMDHVGYEITTYRIDGEYKDGRHPETVEFSSRLIDDLKRRDFTINAMAYNDDMGFVDEFNGVQDMEAKIIRCVGNAEERFGEDALRMMRAIRFSAQLGFEIEDKTYDAMLGLAPTIEKVSMERIQVELVKTLMSDNPGFVSLYQQSGLLAHILPELDDILSGRFSRNSITMLKHADRTPILRYAALFNMAEPELVTKVLKTLKLDNHTIDTVTKIVKYSKETVEENEPAVREAVHKYGRDIMPLLFEHERARISTKEEVVGIPLAARKKHLVTLEGMYSDILNRGDCISIKDLDITGHDLMEYGLSGIKIGETLNELLHIVIENPKLNDKATLIAMIEHLE